MRIRSSGLKSAVLAALVPLIFIPTAAKAGEARAPESRCERPSSDTLIETGKIRVYAIPEESEEQAEQRNPTIAGRPVFACLKATGRSRLLDRPEVGGEKSADRVKVDGQVFATNSPLVAYVYSQYYLDTHETWVRVRNIQTGRVIRTCLVGGAIAPRPGHVADIVLNRSGEVGWDAQGERQPESEEHVPGCNPTA